MTVTETAPGLDYTRPIKALFFDLDDTLLLNPTIINLDDALTTNGHKPYPKNQHAMIAGLTAEGMVEAIHRWAPETTYEKLMESYADARLRRMKDCTVREGVNDLVNKLANAQTIQTTTSDKSKPNGNGSAAPSTNINNVDIAIVTNSALDRAQTKLAPCPELLAVFKDPDQLVTTSHPVAVSRAQSGSPVKPKPHPDLYFLALDIVNVRRKMRGASELMPNECLVFEDSIVGIQAARAAGMRVVWNPVQNVREFCEALSSGDKECTLGLREEQFKDHKTWWSGEDPWVDVVTTFENFDLRKYGIEVISAEK